MASQRGGDEIRLRDEDRLPWLETVEPDEPHGPGMGRVIAMALLGIASLASIVIAAYQLSRPGPATQASGGTIAAPVGDYKVKPDDPGGLKVAGEGDAAIATSTGTNGSTGAIDARQVPEKPVASRRAAGDRAAPVQGTAVAIAPVPASVGRLAAPAPVTAPRGSVPGAGSGGSLVQLGAFPSEAAANAAWAALARRFGYVATLGKTVEQADVAGRHVFRLRVDAGSAAAAADVCGRLKVAGEGCFVAAG